MLDYVSRENHVPLCTQYDDLRKLKLQRTLFPAGVLAMSEVTNNPQIKEQSIKEAIPEFMRFNICLLYTSESVPAREAETKRNREAWDKKI